MADANVDKKGSATVHVVSSVIFQDSRAAALNSLVREWDLA